MSFVVMFAVWALAAPMGYIIGDVYSHKNGVKGGVLPILCAILTPMGTMLALVLATQVIQEKEE